MDHAIINYCWCSLLTVRPLNTFPFCVYICCGEIQHPTCIYFHFLLFPFFRSLARSFVGRFRFTSSSLFMCVSLLYFIILISSIRLRSQLTWSHASYEDSRDKQKPHWCLSSLARGSSWLNYYCMDY